MYRQFWFAGITTFCMNKFLEPAFLASHHLYTQPFMATGVTSSQRNHYYHSMSAITIAPWLRGSLLFAGIYNIMWGTLVVLFPDLLWQQMHMPAPNYPELWQCIGMIIGVYGVGYIITSYNPIRYWPMVLVGLLGKIFGPIGFLLALQKGHLPMSFGWTILLNDIIWWIPFSIILYKVYQQFVLETRPLEDELMFEDEFKNVTTNKGWKLEDMSHHWPVVIVFLRHFGCTFCREAMNDLAHLQHEFKKEGKALVLVHMSSDEEADQVLTEFGFDNVQHISDKDRKLYRYFGLRRGFFSQVFGLKTWVRGVHAGLFKGYGIGRLYGDGFQMPGVFLYHKGKVKKKFIHHSAADVPDYRQFIAATVA